MAAALRLLTSPIRVTGPLRLAHLATLVSADVVARWSRAAGRDVEWRAATMAGDLGGQRDMERELAREGLDRGSLGREEFVERVRGLEADGRARVDALLGDLGAAVDLEADALDHPAVVRAGRTAFVRLYEGGRLSLAEQVVDHCPACRTVIDPADSEPVETAATRWLLSLSLVDDPAAARLVVGTVAPELLVGTVAIAVPHGHPAAGARVTLPVLDAEVPVVAADVAQPAPVVPAHDAGAWALAQRAGWAPVGVLDPDGTMRADGPLVGLPRFAARQRAGALLAADLGAGVVTEEMVDVNRRCRRCGTEVVSVLGRHWFLAMPDLEVAAADVVRGGQVTFHPPAAGEELTGRAGSGGMWCLSRQVWAGERVPVATCGDCNQVAVAVDIPDSCGKCMGPLRPVEDVLDSRFLAAVWPLAVAGWPGDHEREVAAAAATTTVLASPASMAGWLLPGAAVALAVSGVVPFAHVALLDVGLPGDDGEASVEVGQADLVAAEGRPVARAALVLAAGGDRTAARALVAGLAHPAVGDIDLGRLSGAVDAAYGQGAPATAAGLLAAAVTGGIPAGPAGVACVRQLAGPIVGD